MTLRPMRHAALAIALAAGALALAACSGPAAKGGGLEDTPAALASESAEGHDEAPEDEVAADEPAEDPREQKRADCVRAIEHVLALIEERGTELRDDQRAEALGDGADECARDATRAELNCVLAAASLDDVQACGA